MTKLKTIVGLCVAMALAVCAFAAQGASAQTAYECTPTTSGPGFSDAHCKTAVASGAAFKHVVIPANTATAVTLTNITTGTTRSIAKLKSVQSGVTLELQATEVEGEGTLENKEGSGVMWAVGKSGEHKIVFNNVTVTAPFNHGCIVTGETGATGVVPTRPLEATTKGLTNQVKVAPVTPSALAEFTISGCNIAALNHIYTLTGSLIGNTEGTTINFTHTATTTQNTLFMFGQKAGFEGSITVKSGSNGVALT